MLTREASAWADWPHFGLCLPPEEEPPLHALPLHDLRVLRRLREAELVDKFDAILNGAGS